jgi:RND family efflux transporter MFP subunit
MDSDAMPRRGLRTGRRGLLAALVVVAAVAGLVVWRGLDVGPADPLQPAAGANGPQAGGQGAGARQRMPAVTLVRVSTAPIEQTLAAIGTGRALQSVLLNAEVSGVVEAILVEPGQQVEAGAPLLRLERRQQEIALAKARADFNIARTNATRFEGLVRDEAASALEQETAQNTLTAAQAQLHQAEYNLRQRTLVAPFAGVIGLIDLDVGDFLSVGSPITTIDDITSLIVDFLIPETASSYVSEGLPVSATAQAVRGREFAGRIRSVDSRIDPVSRTRRVQAVFANDDGALIPGATFSISLAVPGRVAFVVPGLALQWDRAGSYVWRAGPDGRAQRVSAVILQRTAETVLVEASLSAGDHIVAEGADLIRAGSLLPVPRDAAAAEGDGSTAY